MKKLVLLALIASIITGIAVFQFAASLEKGPKEKTQTTVVALKTIPKGTVILPEMITTKEIPVDYVNVLAVGNIGDVTGRITKETIEANEQILTSRLSDANQDSDSLSYNIDPSYRAVTILVDEEKGVAGYLNVGDRIDLVSTIISKGGVVSEYFVENIEILKIGLSGSETKNGSYTSVTVAVPAADVPKLNYVLSIDDQPKYQLVLRSPVDKSTLGSSVYTP